MQFFADLNGLVVFYTLFNIAIAVAFLVSLRSSYNHNWPRENGRALGVLLTAAAFPLFFVYDAYCPDADQPHIRVTGPAIPIKAYSYSTGGRHSVLRHGLLVCIGSYSPNAPALEFDRELTYLLKARIHDQPVTVVYLGRREQANIGSGYAMSSHPVVEIDDPLTGEQLYYIDTTRHWPRVIVLVADALIGLVTFLICIRSVGSKSESDKDDDQGSEADAVDSNPDSLLELGLGNHGKDAT